MKVNEGLCMPYREWAGGARLGAEAAGAGVRDGAAGVTVLGAERERGGQNQGAL